MAKKPEQTFVSEAVFAEALERHLEEKRTAVTWSDLELNKVYKITKVEKKVSVYGVCYILHLRSEEGEEVTVFSPRSLIEEFRQNQKPGYAPYLLSLGVETYKVTRHRKHRYELVFVFEEGTPDVVIDSEPPN